MKVALDVSQAVYGTGVSDYTIELASRLPAVLFACSLRRLPELKRLFPEVSVYPFPPSLMHLLWNQLHVFNVENLVGNIDVYHSSDWTQAPARAKKVTTIHDLAPFLYSEETSPQIVSVHTARMRWVVKECDSVICVSQSTAEGMTKLFPETKSRLMVIPEALPSRFLLRPEPCRHEPYILTIGSRQPRKNISRLISSFLKNRPAEKLIIIGERSNQVTINDERVIFTGYVSDQELVDYLANTQAFVYPSLYEGFGLPILGAFHHKVPVACSDIPVFHETADAGAVYFDPLDEESIASAIASAVKNKKSLTAAGTRQLAKFSWSQTATQTLKVYNNLC